MPRFRVLLEREDVLTMQFSVTVEASSEVAARRKALAAARDDDNENEWTENDSAQGRPRVVSIGVRE